MDFVSGSYVSLRPVYLERIARYRYDVFIERLGWKLQTSPGYELDQFDYEGAHYITVEHDHGEIKGCARLLPTLRPYLLNEIFSPLLDDQPAPSSKDVWELSRFAALDLSESTTGKQMSDKCAIDLLRATMSYARSFGVKRLVSVSPVGVGRLLKRGGIGFEILGSPKKINKQQLVACSMLL